MERVKPRTLINFPTKRPFFYRALVITFYKHVKKILCSAVKIRLTGGQLSSKSQVVPTSLAQVISVYTTMPAKTEIVTISALVSILHTRQAGPNQSPLGSLVDVGSAQHPCSPPLHPNVLHSRKGTLSMSSGDAHARQGISSTSFSSSLLPSPLPPFSPLCIA
eukprot:jgi/Mesvir1/8082/Mv25265-RA.1